MLLRNEYHYLLRQPLSWLVVVLLPLFAWLISAQVGSSDVEPIKKLLHLHFTLLMLALPVVCGGLCPLVFMRDRHANMSELIGVTPLTHRLRLYYRWLSLVVFQIVFFTLALMVISFRVVWFTDFLGWQQSLFSLFILIVPAILLFSSFAMWLSHRCVNAVTIYMVFCAIWFGYILLASLTASPILGGSSLYDPALLQIMRFVDPLGITECFVQMQQGEAIHVSFVLLMNRLICLLLAGLLFKQALKIKAGNSNSTMKADCQSEQPTNTKVNIPAFNILHVSAQPKPIGSFIALTCFHLKATVLSPITWVILGAYIVLIYGEVSGGMNFVEAHSIVDPNSRDALNRISGDVLPLFGALFVAFYAWQLCWRANQVKISELIAVTPVSSSILIFSQYLTVLVLLLLVLVATAVGCLLAQWNHASSWQLNEYLVQLSIVAWSLSLLAGMFVAINACCRNKLIAASFVAGVLIVTFTPLAAMLGLAHPFWHIAFSPLQQADSFWRYAGSMDSFLPFMLFWTLVMCCLLAFSIRYSHRETGYKQSNKLLPYRLTCLLLITFSSGVSLHVQLQQQQPFMLQGSADNWRAEYERQYAHWQHKAQPVLSDIAADIAFFPSQNEAKLTFNFILINQHAEPIEHILIGHYPSAEKWLVTVDAATLIKDDTTLNQQIYQLNKPLLPGESMTFKASSTYTQATLWPATMHQLVTPEFSYIRSTPLLPQVGFNPRHQIRDNQQREKLGLAKFAKAPPSILFSGSNESPKQYDWANVHTIISTEDNHYAIAPGQLIKQWHADGRQYFEYQTEKPIRNMPAWFSLPYLPIEYQLDDLLLRLFSSTKPTKNSIHVQAIQDTFEWFKQHGLASNSDVLNLISMPNIGGSGYALPQYVLINHRLGFQARPASSSAFDQRYRRTVHEAAHQWFGHEFGNGVLFGGAFLVESLAKYMELVMIEQRFGHKSMLALVNHERRSYQYGLSRSYHLPENLLDAKQRHTIYSGATLAFFQLRKRLGDKKIMAALRTLRELHSYPSIPATSMDFVRALKQPLSASDAAFVDKWLLQPLTLDKIKL